MKTRIIHTRIWDDSFFSELRPKEKLFFIYLLTNEKVGLTGIYEVTNSRIKFDTQITEVELKTMIDKFQKSGKFYFDNGWIVIVNANKYNNYTSSPKVRMAYNKELENIPDRLKKFATEVEAEDYKPNYIKSNSTYKHIVIAEGFLKRKLKDNEVVHHIDENPSNNEPSNLAVMDRDKHIALHKKEIKLDDTSMILVSDYSDTPINHKSKTINHKSETINKKPNNKTYKVTTNNGEKEFTLQEIAERLLNHFNKERQTNFSNTKSFIDNLEIWLETYTPEKIAESISQIKYSWWKDKDITPIVLFRTTNKGEPCDRIGDIINSKQENYAKRRNS